MKAKPVLLRSLTALKTLPIQVKPKQKQMCEAHTKPKPDDGKEDWVRFKSECVLLKGRGKAR